MPAHGCIWYAVNGVPTEISWHYLLLQYSCTSWWARGHTELVANCLYRPDGLVHKSASQSASGRAGCSLLTAAEGTLGCAGACAAGRTLSWCYESRQAYWLAAQSRETMVRNEAQLRCSTGLCSDTATCMPFKSAACSLV